MIDARLVLLSLRVEDAEHALDRVCGEIPLPSCKINALKLNVEETVQHHVQERLDKRGERRMFAELQNLRAQELALLLARFKLDQPHALRVLVLLSVVDFG